MILLDDVAEQEVSEAILIYVSYLTYVLVPLVSSHGLVRITICVLISRIAFTDHHLVSVVKHVLGIAAPQPDVPPYKHPLHFVTVWRD